NVSYIVMEYVEGVNLARVIDDHRQLPLAMKLSILIQIADGLTYAHEHGVVHRDMKPSNVCITDRGTAKILDFGLARFDNTRLTKTGYMAGTISYMSPERLNGETGPHDDIFALGAIAYELLTYQRAFAGTMAPEVISKIIAPTLPPMPSQVAGLPAVLDGIVAKALAKDVADRYATAALMADDLRAALQSDEVREYMIASEQPTMDRPLQDFITRPSANPYGTSSGKSAAGAPLPTLRVPAPATQIEAPPTVIAPDVRTHGAHTQPEMAQTQTAAAATQIVPAEKPRRGPKIAAGVAAAAVIALAAFFALVRRVEPPTPVTQKPKPAPAQPQRNPLADSSEVELATAHNLTDALSRRNLTGDDLFRFTEAKARIALAEKKLNDKDYETGDRLISDAITELRAVMLTSEQGQTPPITV